MQINVTNSTSFGAKITKFYVPGKGKTTLRCFVETDSLKIKGLSYDLLSNSKVIEQKKYHNKKGFGLERLAVIGENIQKRVREGYDFLDELFNAIMHGGN